MSNCPVPRKASAQSMPVVDVGVADEVVVGAAHTGAGVGGEVGPVEGEGFGDKFAVRDAALEFFE
ncbi:MAG: hypothetical protein LBI02_04600 [Opitutaceae bacterium]|jgi:hypothetical protein|nr:hypothetical protein [Opitutaceae bacterium]